MLLHIFCVLLTLRGFMLDKQNLYRFLEEKHDQYNRRDFISSDPIGIPHRFEKKEDIEIAGFLVATIAWGQRKTIIKNGNNLVEIMELSPHEFVLNASDSEINRLKTFCHRTFNGEDAIYFIKSLRNIYTHHKGLEHAFSTKTNIKENISAFKKIFFEIDHPERSRKHVSDPLKGSAAKRLNMFLRWMVRSDKRGVDFGLWKSLSQENLHCPLDVHSGNVARKLGLLKRKQNDWKAVEELTGNLKKMDVSDPVKYDFSLFGLGVFEKF